MATKQTAPVDVSKELQLIEKEIKPQLPAAGFAITNPKQMEQAAEVRTVLKKYAKQLETRKKEITDPMNVALKSTRALFSPVENKVGDALDIINKAMSDYQTAEDRRVKEAEAKIAARVGEGSGHIKPETAVAKMQELDRPENSIATASGGVRFTTQKKLKVTNLTEVYMHIFKNALVMLIELDERALLDYLKTGEIVPGAEIEELKIPVDTR